MSIREMDAVITGILNGKIQDLRPFLEEYSSSGSTVQGGQRQRRRPSRGRRRTFKQRLAARRNIRKAQRKSQTPRAQHRREKSKDVRKRLGFDRGEDDS